MPPKTQAGVYAGGDHPWWYLRWYLYADRSCCGAAVYSFFIANFVYKDMGPFADKQNTKPALVKIFQTFVHKDTKHTLYEAGKLTIMLLFIMLMP